MADLTKALDKLEVNPAAAASSPQKKPHEEEATLQMSSQQPEKPEAQEETSPPKAQEEATSSSKVPEETSPPKGQEEASSSKTQEAAPPQKTAETSPPPETSEASPPLKTSQGEGSKEKAAPAAEAKASSPPEADEDLLEFTSATEGEGEASSSAWELVPGERQIARKKGVKSDSELDVFMKKVIKEAEESPPASSKQLTSASSSSKAAVTSIAEEPAEEAEAEKTPSEPDFSFEDGPEQSKDTVTTAMGRKDLLTMDVTSDAEGDKEMVDINYPPSGKRKGRPASHGAKKRALQPKSPRTSSVGASESAKVKAPSPPPRPASANKMPRSASPQAKADSTIAAKPPVKPPPKGITPITPVAVAKPPPKAVTSAEAAEKEARAKAAAEEKQAKLRAEKEAKALVDWKKAQETVAERQAAASSAPASPPMFTTDWSKITSREDFLKKTSDAFRLDPRSAEGFNHHVSSYYYVSSNWGVSHPQSYSSLMLKSDSRQSHRWTCVHCRVAHPDVCDHKTVEEGIIHWWRHHCHHSSWVWCEKAGVFNVTTSDVCKAVLDVDMSERPLPLGGAFHMLPNNLPSHPKGLDKRLFKHPYNKHLTPANHPSEQGLPWNQHLEELQKEPELELTNWQWDLFFPRVLQGNTDVLCFLIHPFTSLKDYVEARKVWHARSFTAPGAGELKDHLVDVEQHSFMLVLLKVLTTKADSHLMPPGQIDIVRGYLQKYEGVFPDRAQEVLSKVKKGISDKDLNYFASVKEYALSAHNLDTPVNIWRIPYPAGHAPVFASPTRLSLVTATQ